MAITIKHEIYFMNGSGNDSELLHNMFNLIKSIHQKTSSIMADFQELKTEFENLKTAIAEERAQATAKLNELQASIDSLTTNIQQGGTAEERDSLLADIKNQVNEVKAIIPDPAEPPIETTSGL